MLKKYNLLSVEPWWKPSWTNCCGSRNSQLYPLDNLLRRTNFGSPHSNSLKNGCLMYGFFTTYTGWLWNWEGNVSNNCTPWWSTLEPTSKCKTPCPASFCSQYICWFTSQWIHEASALAQWAIIPSKQKPWLPRQYLYPACLVLYKICWTSAKALNNTGSQHLSKWTDMKI